MSTILMSINEFLFDHSLLMWIFVTVLKPLIIKMIIFPTILIIIAQIPKYFVSYQLRYPPTYSLSLRRITIIFMVAYFFTIAVDSLYIWWLLGFDPSPSFWAGVELSLNRSAFALLELLNDGALAVALIFLLIAYKIGRTAIGLSSGNLTLKSFIAMSLLGLIGFSVIWVVKYFLVGPNPNTELEKTFTDFQSLGLSFLIFRILWSSSGAIVLEEIIYRGIIYSTIRERIGIIPGVILSSLLFAVGHMRSSADTIIAMFFVGIILALIYERTKSLYPLMLAHAINNLIVLITVYLIRA